MADPKPNVPVQQGRTGSLSRFDPFGSLHREMDRLFEDFGRGWPGMSSTFPSRDVMAALRPSMDVAETEKNIEITAELPGLEQKDIEVNVVNDILTVRGEKKAETEEKDKNYHLVERSYGAFSRSVQLPPGTETDQIKANLSNGVLKVVIPKSTQSSTKKIEVKSS